MLEKMSTENPDLQVILLNGDTVGHAITLDEHTSYTNEQREIAYQNVLDVLTEVGNYMSTYFPNAIVLPTYGNNDTEIHY